MSCSKSVAVLVGVSFCLPAFGRDFRVNQMPNGSQLGCVACHVSAAGGGARNAFGLAVGTITGSSTRAFWSAALAARDSDNDGFSNGVELGDPEGVWKQGDPVPIPGWKATNPGLASSKPPVNQAPQFTSVPVTSATVGLPYSYQAVASDPENGTLTYSKAAGPDWLTVGASGLVSGTPPDKGGGSNTVTLRVTDNGTPVQTADQTYVLVVTASFAGWQALNFNLPAEAALAAESADPDLDGVLNFVEYARRLNPRVQDAGAPLAPVIGLGGEVTWSVDVRDDDPRLSVRMEAASTVTFADAQAGSLTTSDPTPGDGLYRLSFRDPLLIDQAPGTRFWRLMFGLNP